MNSARDDRLILTVIGKANPADGVEDRVAHVRELARQIRIQDLHLVYAAGAGHLGGDFSAIDILATLYGAVLRVSPERIEDPDRDRFILSKGHVAGSLYTTLAAVGIIEVSQLVTFLAPLSALNGHPNRTKVPGVEANTGPLGHGLPVAVGHAIAAKLDKSSRRTFVLMGDGELQEGSNWEALMTANQYHLDNLTIIVDRNRLQQGATVAETNDLEPLADKARAFGCRVAEVDGHDHRALIDLFEPSSLGSGRPTFVIAHTHKGHPISFMSDNVGWHHRVPNAAEYASALAELEAS